MMKKPDNLPNLPGVYLFKNKDGEVIYIGKAKSLKERTSNYFNANPDWKTALLMEDAESIDHIITSSETEALLLETSLIQQYQPKYNVLLKTGQPFLYILFTNGDNPGIDLVRTKKRKGVYFGPFLQKTHARRAYHYLLQTFKLKLCGKKIENGCLEYHLGICPGSCMPNFDKKAYEFRLQLAQDVLKNDREDFTEKLRIQIKEYSKAHEFEHAKRLNEYLKDLDTIFETIKTHFTPHKFEKEIFAATYKSPYSSEMPDDIAHQLQLFLQTPHLIHTIDCFDISHFQSTHLVGSCVRFSNGKPDKQKFRRFSIKSIIEQNDYAALQEITQRRYKNSEYPDLIVIDGGKGQLSAVSQVLPGAHLISLAKREETIFSTAFPAGKKLSMQDPVGRLIIAIRDYAHHFAISYHRLKRKNADK